MGAAVIACGDASPVLELGEHVLDLVALAVERFVIFQRLLAVFGGRDTGDGATLCQAIAEPVAVVAAISDQRAGLWQVGQKRSGALVVADLPGGEVQQDRPSGLIADGVQLGVQTAFCSSQTAGKAPFCARLAAVRWAFRCVASIMIRPGFLPSVASATKMRSNTPSRLHRTKRLYKVLCGP
jgi:hypothetical protein